MFWCLDVVVFVGIYVGFGGERCGWIWCWVWIIEGVWCIVWFVWFVSMVVVEIGFLDDLVMRKRNIIVVRRYGICSYGMILLLFRIKWVGIVIESYRFVIMICFVGKKF